MHGSSVPLQKPIIYIIDYFIHTHNHGCVINFVVWDKGYIVTFWYLDVQLLFIRQIVLELSLLLRIIVPLLLKYVGFPLDGIYWEFLVSSIFCEHTWLIFQQIKNSRYEKSQSYFLSMHVHVGWVVGNSLFVSVSTALLLTQGTLLCLMSSFISHFTQQSWTLIF